MQNNPPPSKQRATASFCYTAYVFIAFVQICFFFSSFSLLRFRTHTTSKHSLPSVFCLAIRRLAWAYHHDNLSRHWSNLILPRLTTEAIVFGAELLRTVFLAGFSSDEISYSMYSVSMRHSSTYSLGFSRVRQAVLRGGEHTLTAFREERQPLIPCILHVLHVLYVHLIGQANGV